MTNKEHDKAPWVDLHLHSLCSDGADSPERLVARAASLGLQALALTDHDTTAGVTAARRAAAKHGLGFLSGIEISAEFKGREMHVVGLGIDIAEKALEELLSTLAAMRRQRTHEILDRLHRIGLTLDPGLIMNRDTAMTLGRMHIAVRLYEMGAAKTVQGAFDRFLNPGRPAHVPKRLPPAVQAIATVQAAGGLAFLAHPGLGNWRRRRVEALLELPFDGLEAWHISHTPYMTRTFMEMAEARALLVSGGSDCHGGIKGDKPTLGLVRVPYACYADIVERLETRKA